MKARIALLLIILPICYGCAVIRSTEPSNINLAERNHNKIVYYLPKGMIHIQQKPGTDKSPYELIVEMVFIPDPDKCYYLERCTNILYNDTLDIKTDKRGLLAKIDVTSESKVSDIIMKVMETVKDVAKIFIPGGGAIPQSARTVADPLTIPFDIIIDPDQITECSPMLNGNIATTLQNIADKRYIKKTLTGTKDDLEEKKGNEKSKAKKKVLADQIKANELEITRIEAEIKILEDNIPSLSGKCKLLSDIYTMYGMKIDLTPMATNLELTKGTEKVTTEGVFYRPLLPYRLHLEYQSILIDKVVYLPNKAPVISLDIKRGATGTKVTKLTFEEGLLTEVHFERPSEALGLISIPAGVVKAVAGLPLELLQFRVDTTTKSNDLLKVQAEQIRLERELLEERRKGINP